MAQSRPSLRAACSPLGPAHAIPLDASWDAQLLAQKSLAAAVHEPLEGVEAFSEGGEKRVVAEHTQGSQCAVAGPATAFGPALGLWRLGHIRGGAGTGRLQGWAALRGLRGRLFCSPSSTCPFLPTGPCPAFTLFFRHPLLEGAVEVDTNAVTRDSSVLIREGEDERGVIPQAHAPLSHAQAALRLAEENDVRGQGELSVILQWVAPQQLWRLGHTVTARVPEDRGQTKSAACRDSAPIKL